MATKKLDSDEDLRIIEIPLGDDEADENIKVGINGKLYSIRRGVSVAVPKSICEALDHASFGVASRSRDGEGEMNTRFVDRKRFPYSVLGTVSRTDAIAQGLMTVGAGANAV